MKKHAIALAAGLLANPALEDVDSGYLTPSPAIAKLVDVAQPPMSQLSPDNQWMAFYHREGSVSLKELASEELKLAGISFNPKNFARTRVRLKYESISFKHLTTQQTVVINDLPQGRILAPSWSPNSDYLSFIIEQAERSELYLYHLAEKKLIHVANSPLNTVVTARPYRWLSDGSGLLINIAKNLSAPPPKLEAIGLMPMVSETRSEKAPLRTYQNLLSTPHDKALFKFYAQGQLAKVNLAGEVSAIGDSGLFASFASSPDSQFILVSELEPPFSYSVPYSRFATHWQIWDTAGMKLKDVENQPLADNIPQGFDSVRRGKRRFSWRADKAATLVWVEAQDDGNMQNDVPFHDIVYTWQAPFKFKPQMFAKVERRFAGIEWGNDKVAMLYDWRFSDSMHRSYIINPEQADKHRILFNERAYNDAYKHPGNFVYEQNKFGTFNIKVIGQRYMMLKGNGASDKGNVPFLDRYDIKTASKLRLWQSEAPYYERVREVLDDEGSKLITLRESPSEQPNFFIRDLKAASLTKFSDFDHPYPEYKDIQKEHVSYLRDDGVALNGTLYLPPGYKKGDGTLPVLMWAYPQEFKDKSVASQLRESPYEFNYIGYSGALPYLSKGIAIFDDPKMPIIGENKQAPNDTFNQQLIASAKAAVDALVEKGIADKEKLAIGGHSYGAFMVANLLAHTNLFKVGIARSGAYNRSLTPFGFQGEERDFWQAPSVYTQMSPFFNADKMNAPLLMIHGKEDANAGTYPMQSERMYNALNGLGKQARLVMLPYEGHSYRAKESILHVLYEQERWLERYLLN